MVVTIGTDAGFVTVSPNADPTGTGTDTNDNQVQGARDTSPSGDNIITEMGWWCDNATEESNFEVGLYSDDPGNNRPLTLLQSDTVNAKGTGAGWKKVTGLNWEIDAETVYWVAVQLDNTSTSTHIDEEDDGVGGKNFLTSQTELPTSWGGGTGASATGTYSVYALVEEAAAEGGGQDMTPYVY